MKKSLGLTLIVILAGGILFALCTRKEASVWGSFKNPETVKLLKQFTTLKEMQAHATTNELPAEIDSLFKAANRGDWLSMSNSFWRLGERNGNFYSPSKTHGKIWETVKEVWGAFDAFVVGDEKYSTEFGREIISSIPAGSIYFGGTDPGRFIVTAMCQSQPDGVPFFVLTQNALTDMTYLDYLRAMYGQKIYIPTATDPQDCFQEYARTKAISRHTDVMNINELLVKTIFDQETNRDFFIEENFPLDGMYPQLEPHGLIFKLNREPLAELSDDLVRRDRDYWRKSLAPKIGDWLTNETSVQTVAAFAKKIFLRHDFTGFTGDARFVQNDYTCKMFSKERSSIAGLYAWRVSHSTSESEKKRMTSAADFAFRQAWALCPYSPEAVYRYVNFLLAQNRFDDAMLVAETSTSLPQVKSEDWMKQLPDHLKQWRKEHPLKPTN